MSKKRPQELRFDSQSMTDKEALSRNKKSPQHISTVLSDTDKGAFFMSQRTPSIGLSVYQLNTILRNTFQ